MLYQEVIFKGDYAQNLGRLKVQMMELRIYVYYPYTFPHILHFQKIV
jgi:hypothetical protein